MGEDYFKQFGLPNLRKIITLANPAVKTKGSKQELIASAVELWKATGAQELAQRLTANGILTMKAEKEAKKSLKVDRLKDVKKALAYARGMQMVASNGEDRYLFIGFDIARSKAKLFFWGPLNKEGDRELVATSIADIYSEKLTAENEYEGEPEKFYFLKQLLGIMDVLEETGDLKAAIAGTLGEDEDQWIYEWERQEIPQAALQAMSRYHQEEADRKKEERENKKRQREESDTEKEKEGEGDEGKEQPAKRQRTENGNEETEKDTEATEEKKEEAEDSEVTDSDDDPEDTEKVCGRCQRTAGADLCHHLANGKVITLRSPAPLRGPKICTDCKKRGGFFCDHSANMIIMLRPIKMEEDEEEEEQDDQEKEEAEAGDDDALEPRVKDS